MLERPWSPSVSRCLLPRRGGCLCDAWWDEKPRASAWATPDVRGVCNSTCVMLSLGAGCPRGPRRRRASGVCLRRHVHAPAIRHLLQVLSPVEQPFHVPRANGHLRCVLRGGHTQYPLSVCQGPRGLMPPSPHSCSPKMEKAKAHGQVSAGPRRMTGQITRKIARPCLVKSKESLGKRMVWSENGKKKCQNTSVSVYFPSPGSLSWAVWKYVFFFVVVG